MGHLQKGIGIRPITKLQPCGFEYKRSVPERRRCSCVHHTLKHIHAQIDGWSLCHGSTDV